MTVATARASLRAQPRLLFALGVAFALAAFAAVVLWDVFHYSWIRGYDAWAIGRYEYVVQVNHRLPTSAESDVWHNPPLFFVVAALLQELATLLGAKTDPYKAVQLLSVAAGIGICTLTLLTARELWPRSRGAQLAALVLAVATPVLVRASVLYHPEPLAAFLVAAATYVLVRAFCRRRFTVVGGAGAGLLLGLANLTRTWALAALAAAVVATAAAWWWDRGRDVLRFGAALVAVAGCLLVPWLAYEAVAHGSPLAYSQPDPAQWHRQTQPLSFYTSLDLRKVFTHPYTDEYRNHLWPVVYTDWWGDYWRYWDVPSTLVDSPPILTGRLDTERRLQSYVGILPSLLTIAGVLALAVLAIRRRSPQLLFLVTSLLLLALSFTGFLIVYPKQDGDNMKALYLLDAALPLAVCGGWAVDRLRRIARNRFLLVGLALIALELVYLDARFLVLT
jgi:hypothetical protein